MKEEDFENIAINAHKSSTTAFSKELWKKRWSRFIDDVMGY